MTDPEADHTESQLAFHVTAALLLGEEYAALARRMTIAADERSEHVRALHALGMSHRQIARALDITPQRVGAILKR